MTDEDNVIDAEIVDNLPAVIEQPEATHDSAPPIEGRDWSSYSRPERRCTAHSSRTGDQCKNVAILGHNVCRYHGGAAKQVKQAARTRLENAADLMAKELLGIALTADTESVKLAAVRDALDRAGLKAPSEVVLSQGEPKAYETVFDSIGGSPTGYQDEGRGRADAESHSLSRDYNLAGGATDSSDVGPHASRPTASTPFGPGQHGSDSGDRPAEGDGLHPASVSDTAERHAPDPDVRPHRVRRARPQHITGEDAMRIAAELKREQLALESPHKRYNRP
jgi:hypothetical protein